MFSKRWQKNKTAITHGLWLSCLLAASSASSGLCVGLDETRYDTSIERAVNQWWIDLPIWALWKAQLYAESAMSPLARSGVGAEGLAQIMPATWRGLVMTLKYPDSVSAYDADYAIEAGAYYDAHLRHDWRRNRTPIEAHWLAVASYNRGEGWIIKDQAECDDAHLWSEIAPCTARHTPETPAYVNRIKTYWKELER